MSVYYTNAQDKTTVINAFGEDHVVRYTESTYDKTYAALANFIVSIDKLDNGSTTKIRLLPRTVLSQKFSPLFLEPK